MSTTDSLQRTALYPAHLALGARMVLFAGWEMPIQYPRGILAEARAVRSSAGIFDVSHMGRIEITGRDAPALMDLVLTQDVMGLKEGRARYALLCTEEGGITDDVIIYRLGPDHLLLVCNAGNRPAVWPWLQRCAGEFNRVDLKDTTEATVMIALQGPQTPAILERLAPGVASALRPFAITRAQVAGVQALVARTGYTGEDGFEVMAPAQEGERLWGLLIQGGAAPCGLGARDVLRLEAALPLHGHDMDVSTNPFEAGLERFVNLQKGRFLGQQALQRVHANGVARKLVGFVMTGRGIARSGCSILSNGQAIGQVTSGGPSATLDKNIGLGYVAVEHAQPGASLIIDIRGNLVEAQVVPLPFYSRRRGL
ncbi:MAG: glycine cleavage system aminomethyltransferase GcvT [Dehalococcoidia bacterium]|nr:glycine cleavage system aminomethyltransferase GcvT [Dehalococcoidia bacterium]